MTEYLNVWVGTTVIMSVPLKTELQVVTGRKIFQGERDANVFMIIEESPRKVIEV